MVLAPPFFFPHSPPGFWVGAVVCCLVFCKLTHVLCSPKPVDPLNEEGNLKLWVQAKLKPRLPHRTMVSDVSSSSRFSFPRVPFFGSKAHCPTHHRSEQRQAAAATAVAAAFRCHSVLSSCLLCSPLAVACVLYRALSCVLGWCGRAPLFAEFPSCREERAPSKLLLSPICLFSFFFFPMRAGLFCFVLCFPLGSGE